MVYYDPRLARATVSRAARRLPGPGRGHLAGSNEHRSPSSDRTGKGPLSSRIVVFRTTMHLLRQLSNPPETWRSLLSDLRLDESGRSKVKKR